MKRPGVPRRRREIARGSVEVKRTRIRRQNAARKAKEFLRTYGSPDRAEWVRAQSSVWDGAGPCVNAHVGKVGKGARRKANADQIVSLTDEQHRAFDEYRFPFDDEAARAFVIGRCADVQRRWESHSHTGTD